MGKAASKYLTSLKRYGKNFQRVQMIWCDNGFGGLNIFKRILYRYDVILQTQNYQLGALICLYITGTKANNYM